MIKVDWFDRMSVSVSSKIYQRRHLRINILPNWNDSTGSYQRLNTLDTCLLFRNSAEYLDRVQRERNSLTH